MTTVIRGKSFVGQFTYCNDDNPKMHLQTQCVNLFVLVTGVNTN